MATSRDEQLRQKRLVFYKDDIDKIEGLLEDFLRVGKAKCAMLIDKDGHMVTGVGSTSSYDTDTVSALVAGSFAATKQMAKLLGEEEFSVMFHQGKKDSIQLSMVGERTILACIFDESTTVGMIRHYAVKVADRLTQLFNEIAARKGEPKEAIGADYSDEAKGKLDTLFGQ
jgi:predicted regulator of Ras-like GTPase activity (Roadblock/LC7/MglB family)